MHTTILLIHIFSTVASLGLMAAAIAFGMFGKDFAKRIAGAGMAATAFGAASGTVLLFSVPLGVQCAILTTYVAGMIAAYTYGFTKDMKFVRRTNS